MQLVSERRTAINRSLKLLKPTLEFVDVIYDIGRIFTYIVPGIHNSSRHKKLNRLEDIAAYNVARLLSDHNNLQELHIPRSLNRQVATSLDTY